MPRRAPYRLQWSEQGQTYEISGETSSTLHERVPNTAALLSWLATISSFTFHSRTGAYCTVRQEAVRDSRTYWYGYRSIQHKTIKHYIGRLEDLSIERLEKVAARFTDPASHTSSAQGEQASTSTAPLPLLETKLHPPRLPLGLVERPRLLTRLDAYGAHQLTLLSAPAGFGKSTLVNHWCAERQDSAHVAWISLDSSDNDPVHFWRTVLTASHIWHPAFEESIIPTLLNAAAPAFAPSTLETVLTTFLNQADKQNLTGLIILDNYHTITAPTIHDTLNFFLTHLPETLHMILITRTEPPIPLARLRANGELNEIQAVDLRFTPAESATFLQRTVEYDLSQEMLERIESQVEGWAAGLRLLSLSLRGKTTLSKVEQVLASFRGKQRPVRDYFVTEVLRAQSEPLQDFLLRTSLLKRFNASLCNAITGRQDSLELLEMLERSNLFLESLDSTGEWYHYQNLFAEAMQHEALQRLGEQELARLAQLTSHWFEQQGLLSEAIETALAAGDNIRAANLLEGYTETMRMMDISSYYMVRLWLEQLPGPLLEQRPQLSLIYAITLIFGREQKQPEDMTEIFTQIERLLAHAEAQWEERGDPIGRGRVFAFRAFFSYPRGIREQSLRWGRQALDLLPKTEPIWRGMSLCSFGMHALQAGELSEARQVFQEIKDLWHVSDSIHVLQGITLLIAIIDLEQGKLHQTDSSLRELSTTANQQQNHGIATIALLLRAQISYEWNDLEQAEQQIQEVAQTEKLLATIPHEFIQLPIEFTLARLQYVRGEREPAIQRMEALLTSSNITPPSHYIYHEITNWLIRHALSMHDHAAAQEKFDRTLSYLTTVAEPEIRLLNAPEEACTAEQAQTETSVTSYPGSEIPVIFQEQRALIIIRLAIAKGETTTALSALQRLLPSARSAGRRQATFQILLLSAQAYAARMQLTEARQTLLEALMLGHVAGYQRTILDEGEPLAQLLRDLLPQLHNHPLQGYATRLLRAFAQAQTNQSTIITPLTSLIYEPLSPQEQRVLRLLASGNSNAEIANELVVSINTIRTQVQSIYRKLQVNNRHAASHIARNLHLI